MNNPISKKPGFFESLVLAFCLTVFAPFAIADENIAAIRAELNEIKNQYEQRIQSLEMRLQKAEQQLAEKPKQSVTTAPPVDQENQASTTTRTATSGNQYNPAIGVILNAEMWGYSNNPDNHSIPGFVFGGESGLADEGISVGESEFVFSGNVDHWFYAQITAAIEQEDGEFHLGLEEAFIETLSMPASITLRLGRFFSAVGYANNKHKHTWDFADQSLPYRAFMGSRYGDDGVQMRWLAPTNFFLEFGTEIFRGGSYPAGGNANSGLGATSLFAHSGGDVGNSHSWAAGLSWLGADAIGRESGGEDSPLIFDGSSDIYIADFVWKWAPNGNSRQQNFTFQAEYLWRNENGQVILPGTTESGRLNQDSQGWYAQAIYQWKPRWRTGVRIDGLNTDQPGQIYTGTVLDPQGHKPRRYSLMLDYSNSEFSRLRIQYNRDESDLQNDNQIGLQYIMSIGAHGGHEF